MATVSVIIPTFNQVDYLGEAIDSALAQTHPPLEVIVVDDGSTDATPEVLASYGDRIRSIRKENGGAAAARNAGIAAARGEYVAFLDSDDLWVPRKLALQLALFDRDPSLGLVHCGVVWFDATGRTLKTSLDGMEGWVATELLRLEREVVGAPGSAPLVPKRIVEELGGFDERLRMSEDWDFLYRLARRYPIGHVRELLVRYRIHDRGIHHDVALMERSMLLALGKAFASDDPAVQSVRRESYGRLHRILSGGYFQNGDMRRFVQHMLRSLRYDWRNARYFAAYPLRLIGRLIARVAKPRA